MAARPRDAATASTHHVPQLVVEGVPLPARGTITHVDVEGSAREVGDISAALAIVSELLAHDVADEPKAFEEARGVQGVLRRERLARALQRVWAGRNAAYAGPRLGVELIGRPAWHARQGAPAGPRVRAARRTHSDDAARAWDVPYAWATHAPKKVGSPTAKQMSRMLEHTVSHWGTGRRRGSGWRQVVSCVRSCIQKSRPPCSTERHTSHGLSGASRKKVEPPRTSLPDDCACAACDWLDPEPWARRITSGATRPPPLSATSPPV